MPLELNSGEDLQTAVAKSVSALNADAVEKTKVETQKLVDSAKSGGFRISPEGVEPLKQALVRMQGRLDELALRAGPVLNQTPKLGSHDYGKAVANHNHKGQAGDSNSADRTISQLR